MKSNRTGCRSVYRILLGIARCVAVFRRSLNHSKHTHRSATSQSDCCPLDSEARGQISVQYVSDAP